MARSDWRWFWVLFLLLMFWCSRHPPVSGKGVTPERDRGGDDEDKKLHHATGERTHLKGDDKDIHHAKGTRARTSSKKIEADDKLQANRKTEAEGKFRPISKKIESDDKPEGLLKRSEELKDPERGEQLKGLLKRGEALKGPPKRGEELKGSSNRGEELKGPPRRGEDVKGRPKMGEELKGSKRGHELNGSQKGDELKGPHIDDKLKGSKVAQLKAGHGKGVGKQRASVADIDEPAGSASKLSEKR
ncbi:hypothetical protein CBR_g41070 [Chara braunii]|uniref:Uncharacterized protein n=1 Tax=Chara braunii TaxID=69332 RepID=A0A388LV11_CHABU|nr:hypothetical protein CBR_g41070 [Chara braunii]|eukprot:GBG86166.1 hypothetical protein CBR_g41070 [Chara braunii]